jgi:exopolysaccharide biosynthesis polyprenyl glycosylphosphotransferase
VAFFYINPSINIAPKTNLIIYILVFAVLFTLWRRVFNVFLFSYIPKERIIIIGLNEQVKELAKDLYDKPHLGFRIHLIIGESPLGNYKKIPITSNLDNILEVIKKERISTIILAEDPHNSAKLRTILFACLPYKINFVSLSSFYENVTGKIPIEAINQMWFLENLNEGNKVLFSNAKRFYDVILAFFILIITAPFWPLIGIAIKLESRGSIFFTQSRLGQNKKMFRLIKFRSMREESNDGSLTVANDRRVTKFGSFMRKTRIDELPQVLNILSGDMSFVGPRPEQPKFINELEIKIPFYNERLLVKPGVTGWAQVAGGYLSPTVEDTLKKLQYDLFYVKNRSIYLDLSIILKTIAIVIKRGGM